MLRFQHTMQSRVCWTTCADCLKRSLPARALTCDRTSQLGTKRSGRSHRAAPVIRADAATAVKKTRGRKAAAAVKPPLPSVRSAVSSIRALVLRRRRVCGLCVVHANQNHVCGAAQHVPANSAEVLYNWGSRASYWRPWCETQRPLHMLSLLLGCAQRVKSNKGT